MPEVLTFQVKLLEEHANRSIRAGRPLETLTISAGVLKALCQEVREYRAKQIHERALRMAKEPPEPTEDIT